ncbi:sodium- and chloride-dependent GABA transporter 1-like [Macrosteles quadrilineatus]|uniref:sodium- and chloride-dependent GABA transporter 1-like n=1 Tax=Macrosteles quadrilineatus TaxID=74068 RepID=UPI0023E1DD96|nr:sodium- and chloride-dependent GABA transporter 1-like [Macrosteles quadrilineatus]XP_054290203.1 sodium- and chloride-dependent GABA transporter 1-like [Macrosteles quadrilineatus]
MSEKMYYWGQEKDVDPEQTFIEFSAKQGPSDGVTPQVIPPQPEEEERGGWGNKLDFLFSCISVSVGLGNVWRFPYLCYKNGGGAFLVTYGIAMVFCGIPIFFQEVAVGQYLGAGGMTLVGQLCPLLQGVGYATMTIVFFLDIYYCIIISWTLFYLIASFTSLPGLPWEHCDNWWNTETCFAPGMNATLIHNRTNHTTTPVEEYWDKRVLQISPGIDQLGGMQWELLGSLLLGWVLIYLIICRGLHQSGKIIWFTALFPYVVLLVLLVRGVTLPGAGDGLLYYITPRWEELLGPGPWIDGATQIFFAYSIGTGALPALGSYNKFHHNCYKDAIITCIVNTLTCLLAGCVTFSILGNIALEQGTHVSEVVKSGPGLVFLTYPEVVLKLPGAPAWAAIFFSMLVILGIDSEFCIVESFITGMVDNWPETLRPHRAKFTMAVCVLLCLLGIPMVTQGGAYIFQLMDYYSASGMCLLWVCFFQTIAISWIFGAGKFIDCVHQMMGVRPNRFWYFCWVFFAPATMVSIFIFYIVMYVPAKYGPYVYPDWAELIGIGLSLSSMLWIPGYAIYYLITTPGTFKENLVLGLTPNFKSRARVSASAKSSALQMSESSAGLLSKNSSFLNP